jgi:hypothetical protein
MPQGYMEKSDEAESCLKWKESIIWISLASKKKSTTREVVFWLHGLYELIMENI